MYKETFEVELSSDFIPLLTRQKRDVPQKLKEMAVIELFREGKISTGKAAQLLKMPRSKFILLLSQLDIPYFNQSKEELLEELSNA